MTSVTVTKVAGLSTIQDGGRRGTLHQGVPPGGALVPALLARANAGARNPPEAAAIETFGAVTLVANGSLRVARDDGTAADLRDGEAFAVACGGARVAYLAVRGGFDVPVVLGGRGTLLVASLGGHEGRPLRPGDVLAAGTGEPVDRPHPPAPDRAAPVTSIGVLAGPDREGLPAGTFDALLAGAFTVSLRSDRVGVRLDGTRLARRSEDAGVSGPMVQGAIQLPPDGVPIVLGPDHPTTGGYPVVAVVVRRDQGRLLALPIGSAVRLVANS
jgi:biotin-dependent carboxylase-like uncharacterized protein